MSLQAAVQRGITALKQALDDFDGICVLRPYQGLWAKAGLRAAWWF